VCKRRRLVTELEEEDIVVLEAPVGGGRRIDVEVGATVIEVKRDLRKGRVRQEAIEQLAGYVANREQFVRAKRAAGRAIDMADLALLEEAGLLDGQES
jgi:N-methylhydantoinase B/oxoprolinase/acetone carboxylase alpha subunit